MHTGIARPTLLFRSVRYQQLQNPPVELAHALREDTVATSYRDASC